MNEEPKYPMRRLHVCVPNYRGVVEQMAVMNLLALFHSFGKAGRDVIYVSPTHTIVQTARQTCVEQALADPLCTHVLFIDDDMVFGPDAYFQLEAELMANDLDFVCALGFSNAYPTKPCIFGLNPEIEEWGELPWWHVVTDYPRNQRFEVAAAGFGMVLMTRRMLESMRDDNFALPKGFARASFFTMDGCRNEDVAFCLNARKKGFKLYCDSRVKIGHISKERHVIDEELYDRQGNMLEYHAGVPPVRLEQGSLVLTPVKPDATYFARQDAAVLARTR